MWIPIEIPSDSCFNDSSSTCCQHETAESCTAAAKPSGKTVCEWNEHDVGCALELDQYCLYEEYPDPPPCSCFVTEDECDAARFEESLECDWAGISDVCVPTACLDVIGCPCFERERDCIDIEEFPEQCVWGEDVCYDHDRTTTTGPSPTCKASCSCFETENDCELNQIDTPLVCLWMDECVPFMTTETPMDTTGSFIMYIHSYFTVNHVE